MLENTMVLDEENSFAKAQSDQGIRYFSLLNSIAKEARP